MGDIHGIPDDVLELILVLLASPAHLIPAASTCKRWHGIVAGARFLSHFNSLNRRHLVAGYFYNGHLQVPFEYARPSFVPSSSPSVVDARRFSLDFLWSDNIIDSKLWKIVDSRGGLLLKMRARERFDSTHWRINMVVCEPLARRYKVIPPMVTSNGYNYHSGPFLLDGGRASGINLSNFRVMCLDVHHHYYASMFTSSEYLDGGSWHGYAMDGQIKMRFFMGHTRASLYWHDEGRTVTTLDRSTAQLSSLELPESMEHWDKQGIELKVAAGRDGEPRILALAAGGVLRVFAMPQGAGEWEPEKTIQLSAVAVGLPGYLPSYFSGDGEEEASINVTDTAMVTVSVSKPTSWYFIMWAFRLDLETLEAELVDIQDGVLDLAFPCEVPWPPVLHART